MADQQSNEGVRVDLNAEALDGLYPDERQQKEIEKLDAQITRAFYGAFSGEDGQQALAYLEEQFGGLSYVQGDPHETVFREGQRHVVLTIKEFINRATKGE